MSYNSNSNSIIKLLRSNSITRKRNKKEHNKTILKLEVVENLIKTSLSNNFS